MAFRSEVVVMRNATSAIVVAWLLSLPVYANSDMPGTASVIIETVPVVPPPKPPPPPSDTQDPDSGMGSDQKGGRFDPGQGSVSIGGQNIAVNVRAVGAGGGSVVSAPKVPIAGVSADVQVKVDSGGNVGGSTVQTQMDAGGTPATVDLTVDAGGNVGGTVQASQPVAAVEGADVTVTTSVGPAGGVVATAVEVKITVVSPTNVPPAMASGPEAAAGLGALAKSLKSLSVEDGVLSPEQYNAALSAFAVVRTALVKVQFDLDNAIATSQPPAQIQQIRVFQAETLNKVNQAEVQLSQLAQNAAQVAAQAAQTQQSIIGKLPDVVGGAKKAVGDVAKAVSNDPKLIAKTTLALLGKTQEKLKDLNQQLQLAGLNAVAEAQERLAKQLQAFYVDKGQAHPPAYNPTVRAAAQAKAALSGLPTQLRQSKAATSVRLSATKSLIVIARSVGRVEKLLSDFRNETYINR